MGGQQPRREAARELAEIRGIVYGENVVRKPEEILFRMFVVSPELHIHLAGLVIGLSLTLVHILGISLTGTSVNPARSLGTAIFATDTTYIANVWIFLVAPLVGGVLAALCYKLLDPEKKEKK